MKRGKVRKSKKNLKISGIKDFVNNKRLLAVAIAAFFIVVIVLSFVSFGESNITGQASFGDRLTAGDAGGGGGEEVGDFIIGINAVGESVIKILRPIAEFLLGDLGGEITEKLLFAKVLFFVIILGIVWLSLKKIPLFDEKPVILNIVAFAVSVLAVRGIATEGLIKTIMFPSEVLGLALVAGIPFIIYFTIVNVGFKGKEYSIVRRIAWIFFAVIFIGLWFYRKIELGDLHSIYLITAIGAGIMAVIDGTLQKFFLKIEEQKLKNLNKQKNVMHLKKELAEIDEAVREKRVTLSEARKMRKNLNKEMKYFTK